MKESISEYLDDLIISSGFIPHSIICGKETLDKLNKEREEFCKEQGLIYFLNNYRGIPLVLDEQEVFLKLKKED